jgi:FKBP-type peptidyl-prolyl cis-trans isomerase (trigger factor)
MLKLIEIAINDGMKKGMEKGMQKGIRQTAKEMLVAALEEKFDVVPARIIDQIRSIDQHEVLRGLHRQAIKCNSWDAFEGKLKFAIS